MMKCLLVVATLLATALLPATIARKAPPSSHEVSGQASTCTNSRLCSKRPWASTTCSEAVIHWSCAVPTRRYATTAGSTSSSICPTGTCWFSGAEPLAGQQ